MSRIAVVSVAPADADRRLHGLFPALAGHGRPWVEIGAGAHDGGGLADAIAQLLTARSGAAPSPAWTALATGETAAFAVELADAEGLRAVPTAAGTVITGDDPAPAADLVEGAGGGQGRLLLLRPRADAAAEAIAEHLSRGAIGAAAEAADLVLVVASGRGTALVSGDGITNASVAALLGAAPGRRTGAEGGTSVRRAPAVLMALLALAAVAVAVRFAGGGSPATGPTARPQTGATPSPQAALQAGVTLAPASPRSGPAPGARQSPATAWDSQSGRLVLFGGTGDAAPTVDLADTWTWDGAVWVAQRPPVSPPARFGAVMAAAPGGGVLLVGGMHRVGPAFLPVQLEDTWRWDGATWTQIDTRGMPAPGEGVSALVADPSAPAGNGLLLLTSAPGGTGSTAYMWTESTWAATHPARVGPAVRLAAPDPAHHQVLVVAAEASSDVSATWAWRSGDWVLLQPAMGVDVDALSAVIALDPRSGLVILVEAHFSADGGPVTGTLDRGGTWTWDGNAWTQQPGPVPGFISAFNATSTAIGYPGGALTLIGGDRGSGAYRQAARWAAASVAWQAA